MKISVKITALLMAVLLTFSGPSVYAADDTSGTNPSAVTDETGGDLTPVEPVLNGLVQVDGVWGYYENGVKNTTYTGIAKNAYGSWYLKDGAIATSFTGTIKAGSVWWYVVKGKVNTTFTGFIKDKTATWYFKNGQRQDSYTGGAEVGTKAYRIKQGKVIYPDIGSLITKTYKGIRSLSRRRSFSGYCGKFSNWTLRYLGINKSYISGNGKDEFDIYRKKKLTSGGYKVYAYASGKYTLESALKAITKNGTRSAYNILVGFDRGSVSKAGQRYGHTFFIHAIINGNVYYSESFATTYAKKRYAEGTVIKCTIHELALHYKTGAFRKSKFDGLIYFVK